jgi:hypothetical protein
MTVRQDLTHWQPREIVLQAGQQSLESFVAGFGRYMLLVVLDEPNSELAVGLQATEVRIGEADGLAFRTVVRDLDATVASDRLASSNAAARISMAASNTNGSDVIPRELLKVPCHIVPIQKRADRSFLQHVSVGRARNHDIVLRHRSVSKFHAWFEHAEGNRLMVRDSDSRNHTFVDGQQITKRAEVVPGQQVRFGSVETRVCTSEGIWLLLHGGG